MRKGTLLEYLELESVEFEDQYIVGGQSRFSHSWFRLHDEILSSCHRRPRRLLYLAISLVTLVVLVAIYSSSKNSNEETPTRTPIARTPINAYNALHLFAEENKLVGEGCYYHCCSDGRPDPANKPYERRVDRSYCEDEFEREEGVEYREDIRNSEILRCYNWTYRYCVPDIHTDVPDNDMDRERYWSGDCAFEFSEDNGSLYSESGSLMKESFKAKCEETLHSQYIYFFSPANYSVDDVPLRYCNCDGTINVDFLTGDGPFNWKEFYVADYYKMGSEDEDAMEEDCERERQKRCP